MYLLISSSRGRTVAVVSRNPKVVSSTLANGPWWRTYTKDLNILYRKNSCWSITSPITSGIKYVLGNMQLIFHVFSRLKYQWIMEAKKCYSCLLSSINVLQNMGLLSCYRTQFFTSSHFCNAIRGACILCTVI
jgi:hypothetical protein